MAAATSVHVVAVIEPIIQHADWFFPEGERPAEADGTAFQGQARRSLATTTEAALPGVASRRVVTSWQPRGFGTHLLSLSPGVRSSAWPEGPGPRVCC